MHIGRLVQGVTRTARRVLRNCRSTGVLAIVGLTVVSTTPVLAQAPGSVAGRVTDVATGAPVSAVRVLVSGTQNGALTGDDGKFTLRLANAGAIELEISRIGYVAKRVPVTVVAGQPAAVNITIAQAPFSLAAVVTTVTGQTKKVELANATTQINVGAKLADLPVTNMGGLLSGRASSVQVVSTGATGTGSRIRIRGQNSLSLSNDPIVVIDGVRATSTTNNGIGVGGSGASRLDDINPAEIENIEIIKGPSAATLYGTEAANGVIVITTKRGKSGSTKYNVSVENGTITDPNTYPELYSLWGKTGTSTVSNICLLTAVASGACKADSLSHGNVLNIKGLTPIDQGARQQYNFQASGGNDRTQFFVSAQTENETGTYKMPSREITRLLAYRGVDALPSSQIRPNALARNSLRANLSTQLSPNWFVQVSSAYVNSNTRLPQNEDNSNGLMVNALGSTWRQDLVDAVSGDSLKGYRAFQMGDVLSQTTTLGINRFINSVATQYSPFKWLATRATFGSDYTARGELFLSKVGEGPAAGTTRTGNITSQQAGINQQSSDLGATATWQVLGWLNAKSSIGMQYIRAAINSTTGTGIGLPPGGVTVSAAATRSSTQTQSEKRTLGYYAEEVVSINEKLFLTAGVRRDAANAFGKNFNAVYYPKFGASWVVSDQAFFHKPDFINSLRLRGTYGASGQIPGATDAVRFYNPGATTLPNGSDTPGASLGSLGNSLLKPEFSAETEAGFDLTMFSSRTNIEVTSYNKKTTDALISRGIAPSLSGLTSQFANIGNIQNTGIEMTFNQKVIDRNSIAIDFALSASTNKNRLLKLGEGVSPIATGNRNTQRNLPGYPLYGLWDKNYTYADANGDGIIVLSEMKFTDTTVFQGATFPQRELAFTPSIELFNHKLRFSSQFDHKWNFLKFNNTLRHMCMNGISCRGRYDQSAPLAQQAAALATSQSVYSGMFENGAFTRWREASVSYELPTKWANAVRASRWNVVLTGRNLGVSTKYSGVDPEAAQSNNDARGNEEYFSTPPLRYFTLRMNFSF